METNTLSVDNKKLGEISVHETDIIFNSCTLLHENAEVQQWIAS